MSPLNLRYTIVDSLSSCGLSVYGSTLIPGNSFVPLFCMFSKAILYFILCGYHTATA